MKSALHVLLLLGFAGFIISISLLRKTSATSSENAVISTISSLRSSLRTILSPPYIYLLLNFIIISIAASSSFLHRYFPHNARIHDDNVSDRSIPQSPDSDANSSVTGESDSSVSGYFEEADEKIGGNLYDTWSAIVDENRDESLLRRSALPDGDFRSRLAQLVEDGEVNDDGDTLEGLWKSIADENKRKHFENQTPPKADLTKPEDYRTVDESKDTLAEAWEAIKAEGGGRRGRSNTTVAARRLSKSESTFGGPTGGVSGAAAKEEREKKDAMRAWKELRKSETFNDAVSARRRGGLRRDPSLSVEELNGRVEAFIKNFNHQIRLQRQESEQRFLDMMNGGV